MTKYERINNLKHVLIDYAERHDIANGGYHAIQSVQKMAGYSSEKDYILALSDGLKYGNWPWTIHSQPKSLDRGCEK